MVKVRHVLAIVMAFFVSSVYASPSNLVTHNLTNAESNAFVAGIYPSPAPTKANSTGQVSWLVVRMACFGHTTDGKCPALIKMGTNTDNPVEIGTVYLDVDSGIITPASLVGNGYKLTVNGPGEATIIKVQ